MCDYVCLSLCLIHFVIVIFPINCQNLHHYMSFFFAYNAYLGRAGRLAVLCLCTILLHVA